jgi:short-subunit dehydrogenase
MQEIKMADRLVIVTGASQGIGEGVAYKLANMGYDLALIARTAEKLARVKQNII